MKRYWILFAISLVGGLYTALAAQHLWNWFVARPLNASLTYWEAYGITLLIGLLFSREGEQWADDARWEAADVMMHAAVPHGLRDYVESELMGVKAGVDVSMAFLVFNKAAGNSVTLAIGWAIHSFLM